MIDQQAVDDLVGLLDLEAIEVNIFRGITGDDSRQRVFGGHVAAQALVAAARTIDTARPVHSLHAYFLRPGDPMAPILYEVDRLRDGRSFTTRRVVAIQHGEAIFNLQASFHSDEPGPNFQRPLPTDIPDPDALRDFRTRMAPYRDRLGAEITERAQPIDLRFVGPDPMSREGVSLDAQAVWLRAAGTLPDDPVIHTCVVTYASDMTLLDTAALPFGISWDSPGVRMASLDHAMWFHRPFRADEWLLYSQHSFSMSSARGLAGGSIFTADGELAVSVVQEGLIRIPAAAVTGRSPT